MQAEIQCNMEVHRKNNRTKITACDTATALAPDHIPPGENLAAQSVDKVGSESRVRELYCAG